VNINYFAKHCSIVMRGSLGFVFLWFGISEITDPLYWSGYVPPLVVQLSPFDIGIFVQMHGIVLSLLALALFFKFHIRYTGFLSIGVLLAIIGGLVMASGFNEIVVRDIGLLGLAIAIWLQDFSSEHKT
jgi:hypothetical protein